MKRRQYAGKAKKGKKKPLDVRKLDENVKSIEKMRKQAEEDGIIKPQMATRLTPEEEVGFTKKQKEKKWWEIWR